MKFNFKDKPKFSGIGPGLNAIFQSRNFYNTELDLGLRVLQMVMGSIYELHPQWVVLGNVGWQEWSKFGQVDVTFVNQSANSLTTNANYQDTWHVAGGVMFKPFTPWTFTAGVGYDRSAAKDENRITFPVGDAYRFGLGAI
jgi:long-chain fatty acid transport protein